MGEMGIGWRCEPEQKSGLRALALTGRLSTITNADFAAKQAPISCRSYRPNFLFVNVLSRIMLQVVLFLSCQIFVRPDSGRCISVL